MSRRQPTGQSQLNFENAAAHTPTLLELKIRAGEFAPLPDVCRARHGGDPASENANTSIHEQKHAIRQTILAWIIKRGVTGATCDEVEEALYVRHQTASARLKELRDMDLIERVGRRETRSGRWAHVLIAKP